MNKKTLKKLIILTILLVCMLLSNTAYAAGNFKVNKSSIEITEGKTSTFTIDGSAATGKVEITSSDSSIVTVSSASVWLEKSTSSITVTGKRAGTATITVTGLVADDKGVEDTITRTVKVTVKAKASNNNDTTNNNTSTNTNTNTNTNSGTTTEKPKEKSTNAYLSTLGVTPKEYDFSGFKKTKMNYSVTVPNDIDSLKILYKTADSNAKVKITGNSGFEVGSDNKITIKVTAEDGKTTKVYTIKVTKLAEEEEKPGNVIENEEGLYLTKLVIDAANLSPEFSKDVYSYTATLNDVDIKDLLVEAESNNKNAKIEISGNTGLVEGENIINIVLTTDESSIQAVYQVIVTAHFTPQLIEDTENTLSTTTDLIGNIKSYTIIAVGVILFIILAIIILIVLIRKESKKTKEEDIEETDAEYNVYENDANEFGNSNVAEKTKEVLVEETTNETETNNKRRRSRKEKGKHSK